MKKTTLSILLLTVLSLASLGQAKRDSKMKQEPLHSILFLEIFDASTLGIQKIDTSTKGYKNIIRPMGGANFELKIRRVTTKYNEAKPPALGFYIYLYKWFEGNVYCYPTTLINDTAFTGANYWMEKDSLIHIQLCCGRKSEFKHVTLHPPLKKEDSAILTEGYQGELMK